VLDTGERVINYRATLKAIADRDGSNLGDYLDTKTIRKYIDKESILSESIEFHLPGSLQNSKGIKAETFLEICRGYASALSSNDPNLSDRQREIAMRCIIILSSCAKIGLIALIDEATGYQYERAEDALQIKLRAYVQDELREWEKTFPDELWEAFGRLAGWDGPLHLRPRWWGKLVMELIYEALDPDIANHLRETKPPPRHGSNYHQWLTSDIGLRALNAHIHQVIGISTQCSDIKELKEKVAHQFKKQALQLQLKDLPKPG